MTKPLSHAVQAVLTDEPKSAQDIANELGCSRTEAHNALTVLVQANRASRFDGAPLFVKFVEPTNPAKDLEVAMAAIIRRRSCSTASASSC